MKLSVVIVNYNVKYFLEQCLRAVEKAMVNIDGEVWVVDNNSVDGSVAMVQEKFSWVKLIASKENLGFSKGNNLAIRKCSGEYVLLLNPDTVVEEDTFEKTLRFMDEHPDSGGLGVQMVDGKGKFLPESKRSLPTPEVAFYKIFGLSMLFPRSKRFGKYHLGYLDKNETHKVDVLSGAFMMLRSSLLDKIGLLDEEYFMYGEDIDLSYRITKGGYNNYYYAGTRIIHYKGESTKKSSVNYVFVFYNAMIIFARKHFSKDYARTFSFLIHMAIYFRAFLAIVFRFFSRIHQVLIDFAALYGGLYVIKNIWERLYFNNSNHFPEELMLYHVPLYIVMIQLGVYVFRGYERPYRMTRMVKGVIWGAMVNLIVYGMLPERFHFSRALIIWGSILGLFAIPATRMIVHFILTGSLDLQSETKKRILLVGYQDEVGRVENLIRQTHINPAFIGYLLPDNEEFEAQPNYYGSFDQMNEVIQIHRINEVIFCAKDMSAQRIIDLMKEERDSRVEFKIAPPESMFIVGSNSINEQGELYVLEINAINSHRNQRAKRLFDLMTSAAMFVLIPFLLAFVEKPLGLVKNIKEVIMGQKSWVGYDLLQDMSNLPPIKSGILTPSDVVENRGSLTDTHMLQINALYAKDYKTSNDLMIMLKSFKKLGRQS